MNNELNRLNQLGHLHDAVIDGIQYDPITASLTISLTEMYENFEGLKDYPGEMKGSVQMCSLSSLKINIINKINSSADGFIEPLTIFGFEIDKKEVGFNFSLKISPTGTIEGRCLAFVIQETHPHLFT